MPTGRTV